MRADVKERWTAALRSGDYAQGKGELHSRSTTNGDGEEIPDRFCCLGVLCDLAVQAEVIPDPELLGGSYRYGVADDESGACLPDAVQKWAGLDSAWGALDDEEDLATLNDNGTSFEDIATVIDKRF